MSFISWLEAEGKKVEEGVAKIFPFIEKGTQEAANLGGLVTAINPGVGAIFSSVAATALNVEKQFAAAGQQTGTGTQKLAAVLSQVGPVAQQLLGPSASVTDVTNVVNAVVNLLNTIPASGATPVPAPQG